MTAISRVRIATAIILIAGWASTLVISWPGHMSFDSIVQLHDGRTGFYHSWHPPIMALLLGIGDALLPGTGVYMVFVTALLFGSFVTVLWTRPRAFWVATVLAVLFLPTPQFLLYPAIVWKDVLFAGSALAGFVCLALAESHWAQRYVRIPMLAVSFLLLVLAALTRQNGVIVLLCGVIAFGWIAARNSGAARGVLFGAAALVVTMTAVMLVSSLLGTRSDNGEGTRAQLRLLRAYDLIGAISTDPHYTLDRLKDAEPELEAAMRTDGVRLYTPQRNDTLVDSATLQKALGSGDPDVVAAQWYDLIFRHPLLYLKVRARAFGWVVLTPDIAACRPVFTGIEGPAGEMEALGMAPRKDARDLALANYAKAFMGTPVLSHAAYGVLAIAALVILLRRRSPGDIAMASLLLSAAVFTASFFVVSIACDYRYLYYMDVAALCAVFYLALDPPYLFQVVAMWSGSFWELRSEARKS